MAQEKITIPVTTMKNIEDMSLDEIDALTPEQVTVALQRAEIREKAMRLAQLSKELRAQESKSRELQAAARDRAEIEKKSEEFRKAIQKRCSHMKGGMGPGSVLRGEGTASNDYAIIRHKLPSGGMMLLCQRCGREEYSQNPLTGQPETPGFAEFNRYPTLNQTSGSTLFIRVNPIIIERERKE